MPATEITEVTRPAYVITMAAAVADIMIAAHVVIMIVVMDVDIMDMVVVMAVDTIVGNRSLKSEA
jgi:hypothetical protein